MSSISTVEVGPSVATTDARGVPAAPSSGWLGRLDLFLSEPLRRAAPEALARDRVLVCIALWLMLIDAAVLLLLPRSPSPLLHCAIALSSLTINGVALLRLRRGARSELSALLVCWSIAVLFVITCVSSDAVFSASHASGMLLPALSVYLVGARQGLVLSALLSVFVGIIHPEFLVHVRSAEELTAVRMQDTFAALCILGIWAVSWMHASARAHAHEAREEALRTVRESEHKLASLINHTDDHICSLDARGRLIIGNAQMLRAFTRVHGRTPVPGEPLLPEGSPGHAHLLRHMARCIAGESVRIEDVQQHDGRTCYLDISFKPMFTPEGKVLGVTLFGRDITERKESENKLREMHRSLMDISRQAGMAEVATGLLHNVGNTLNSVNVSAHLVIERLQGSRLGGLTRAAHLLREHQAHLIPFLTTDPQGQRLPTYLMALAEQLSEEHRALIAEQRALTEGLEHVKSIVSMQQEHARLSALEEVLSVPRLINDALRLHAVSFERVGIEMQREYEEVPPILVDRHKLLQILLNLLGNARHALLDSERADKRVTLRIAALSGQRLCIQVRDNGKGILPEHLGRIFTQGFTTKKDGHGFGLHISALAATEMSGRLSVESAGAGQGATFTLELPIRGQGVTAA